MKSLIEVIQEAKDDVRWVAISVTTDDPYKEKNVTSQRVVSVDTYNELREKGHTKSHSTIVSIDVLSPKCRTREEAMGYIDQPKREKRKSDINKGGAQYIVYAISNGQLKSSGDTAHGWNIWEDGADGNVELYTNDRGGYFLYGAKGSLKVGDTICIVDNDTHKKLCTYFKEVAHILPCDSKENFVEAYRNTFPNYCKRPSYSFGRKTDGIPWSGFGPTYSIKGISE